MRLPCSHEETASHSALVLIVVMHHPPGSALMPRQSPLPVPVRSAPAVPAARFSAEGWHALIRTARDPDTAAADTRRTDVGLP